MKSWNNRRIKCIYCKIKLNKLKITYSMKTIIKDGTYVRVSNQEAEMKIKAGWSFCSKSDWKKNVRDFGREEVVEKKKNKSEKFSSTYKINIK